MQNNRIWFIPGVSWEAGKKLTSSLTKFISNCFLEYLPNLSVAAQQAYGTANGQFGPLIAGGGLNAASSGPAFAAQNWNAAFGGLYLANVNWDFFAFGRARERIKVAQAEVLRET